MDTALLSNIGNMTVFKFGDQTIKFRAPDCLDHYIEIKEWDNGYIVVMTQYKDIGIEEEYIDLVPILRNLFINPESFLKKIKKVEIQYEYH